MFLKCPILVVVVATFCFSCKKSGDPAPVVPNPVDTIGVGWTKHTIQGEPSLGDIFFNSTTTGFAVGKGIYRSTDGGNSWQNVSADSIFFNVFMTNDGKAFFAGTNQRISKTIDGGVSFSNTTLTGLVSDIFFTDNNTGYLAASNGLYRSLDGGVNWPKVITTGLPFNNSYISLYFINTTGWIVHENAIYRTNGSISDWVPATITGGVQGIICSIYATSLSNVYATTRYGEILKSIDGGINFSVVKRLGVGSFSDIHFVDDQTGYVCISHYIFKTTDGGLNWSREVFLANDVISELHFTDIHHGWAAGEHGIVLIYNQ